MTRKGYTYHIAIKYNDRLQIKQIGLGVTNSVQDVLKLEYKYDTTTTSYS